MFRRLRRMPRRLHPLFVAAMWLAIPLALESIYHQRSYNVPIPEREMDSAFFGSEGCLDPEEMAKGPREKAALVMLARNSELEQAKHTVESVERRFNRWFHYPVVFFNDEEWDPEFVRQLNATVSGEARFEIIPRDVWYFPSWMDADKAKASIKDQGDRGVSHGGLEGYHHMCRFYSGKFYNLEALKEFKWYWRLEPDVDFTCSITYDPFVEMAKRNKKYGFTISLWEERDTCPTLFRHMADWKEANDVPTNNLWKAAVSASWVPWPFRNLVAWLSHRDRFGDMWSGCHYWSNFEIADMDFFRGKRYQDMFEYLDKKGGFYFERWGDAAVHSIAVAMLLDPSQVHHFDDIGYRHDQLYQCPVNSPGSQLPDNPSLGTDKNWAPSAEGGVGCRCECDGRTTPRNHPGYCLNKLKAPNTRSRPWFTWLL
ncbi:hypothetical protein MCOR27_010934 [Pyricularia oryzae]|uniref:Glycolipid 2-alpha-mannosyltransferase n=3 Tax=Pyricularia TaxID=48558 RepID=A0ABQ8N507_PYRGI|nr:glycolipid 2-alpha-mannosyltransferase [Pyricularia oryzae 70-15]KAH8837511.1 hypothetical protein MCOR01_011129 [Pyricularia oryzae]KAI6291402.1 hypothetical protein MCOR33_010650 [Pyricularia grisea]EHA53754.1 glycolipid 2-alpha-mannosyltransferase [Pyricularia oryzae 70-15]KAH9437806.1 hypothetical protein MCOR02_001453 [Pyricularia oryzae]KAI6253186.1 hypothetical protein MCOR19_010242 [Pyricularia oryzae]